MNGETQSIKKRMIWRVLPVLALAALLMECESHIIWNVTESVNGRIGYLTGGTPTKGDYVNFLFTHKLFAGLPGLEEAFDESKQQYRLTKKIICQEGDLLETRGSLHYCNGEWTDTALDKTGSGKSLSLFVWNGQIPEGKAYVLGDSPESFDSRYWGFIEKDKLRKVALF